MRHGHRTDRGRSPLPFAKRLLLRLLTPLIRLWWGTLRIVVDPKLLSLAARPGPILWALWHGHLFLAGHLRRTLHRRPPLWAMVSASRDGEWLAQLLKNLSIGAIRGSSGRGAGAVSMAALEKLSLGEDVAITPDGPKGPARRCKPGLLHLAWEAAVPIVALNLHFSHAIRLNSWDRFQIPLPFSRVKIGGQQILPKFLATLPAKDAGLELLERALNGFPAMAPDGLAAKDPATDLD
ncbi:MAG: lysophospholipid acyltransferase family protein [Puniceicoccales bacterium]|jgi:lysophospholipid acyltransferase (LPLAT)-like uncharacterized protein|nr:lysophospholipid acyltransferase family protein [Puniceicoccales bacterium]